MRLLVATLISTLACTEPPPAQSRHSAILGGTADPTSTNVFLLDLRYDTSASICSAVLISPKVLLTAAHCVDPVYHSATTLTVRATNKPDTAMLMQSDMIDVTTVSLHPSWNPGVTQSDYDLAVLLLAREPVGVTPSQLSRVAAVAGQSIRVVASRGGATSTGRWPRRTVRVRSAMQAPAEGLSAACATPEGADQAAPPAVLAEISGPSIEPCKPSVPRWRCC